MENKKSSKQALAVLLGLLVVGGIYGFAFGYGYGTRKGLENAEAITWWEESPEQIFEGVITAFASVPEDAQKEDAGLYTAVHKSGEAEVVWDPGPLGDTYCFIQGVEDYLLLIGPTDKDGNEWVSVDEDWANPELVVGAKVRVTYLEVSEVILLNGQESKSAPIRKVRWVTKIEPIK